MNKEIQDLGQQIIDLITEYHPADAVHALTKVLAATLVVTRVQGTTLKEMAKLTYKALLASMEEYEVIKKELKTQN